MALDQSWRPDWMDLNPGVYPDHGDDLAAWAWEFLRRNPQYQADYERWAALPDDDGEGNHSHKYDFTVGDFVLMKFCTALPNLPSHPEETVGEYERRTGKCVDTLYRAFCLKWRCHPEAPASQVDPSWEISAPPYSLERLDSVFTRGMPLQQSGVFYRAGWGEDDDSYVETVGFDLRFKIDDQFESVRCALLDRQRGAVDSLFAPGRGVKVINRNVVSKLSDHETKLRFLDAVAADADDEQIINKLYPGESRQDNGDDEAHRLKKTAEKWLSDTKKAANQLMTEKYRTLILFDMIPKAK